MQPLESDSWSRQRLPGHNQLLSASDGDGSRQIEPMRVMAKYLIVRV